MTTPPTPPSLDEESKTFQYDDDNGTEITDLIITLHAFKVENG